MVPVGAVWLDDTLYFNTSPETMTAKLVEQNPNAAVHLESGQDAVIVEAILGPIVRRRRERVTCSGR